ncbi:MAG: 30S ribosome-binding factor RbfA [Candidatus Omnitrophica bacterium]|nr:30S ribosome-binding factor RbfA [Candidatus Omnitrophota bacterium]
MATDKRCLRVAEFIRQEAARVLQRLDNSHNQFFTITRVKVKKDLKSAIIYFSVLGGEEEKNETLSYLEEVSSYLRREIGKGMHIRYIPELYFRFDPSIEGSARIAELLKMAKK